MKTSIVQINKTDSISHSHKTETDVDSFFKNSNKEFLHTIKI
ncbi:hypothetical protein LEP1GSC021_4414 [Leptospira noguchii str. 1993005606]|nr:hypothetical protein LEP1GSC021_4414 [Leptospira noguchii str. 1993005606]